MENKTKPQLLEVIDSKDKVIEEQKKTSDLQQQSIVQLKSNINRLIELHDLETDRTKIAYRSLNDILASASTNRKIKK